MTSKHEEWMLGISKSQIDSDIYSARSWLLTAKCIFPQSFRLQIEEYRLEIQKKNVEECAKVLNDIYRDFSSEPQLWEEIELLIEAIEKSNDLLRKEIFDHLPAITQQRMIIGSAENVVNVAQFCRLMLLLMNKFPETISQYGLSITEKLVDAEKRDAEGGPVNQCRTLLVRNVLPMICHHGNVGVSNKHYYKWLQKAIEFYVCFFTSSSDVDSKNSWVEMNKLLTLVEVRCDWSQDPNKSSESLGDRMAFIRDLFRRSRTDVDGAVNRKQIFYSSIIYLFESASVYMQLLEPSFYEDCSSSEKAYIHICNVEEQEDHQTPSQMQGSSKRIVDMKESFGVGREAWTILHSHDSFEKDFNHLTRRWKCEKWLWFQLFLVDLHCVDGNHKAALSRLKAVEGKIEELSPRKEIIGRVYCYLASVCYASEQLEESCKYILKSVAHLPYTYHPNIEDVTRLFPPENPPNRELLVSGPVASAQKPKLQSVTLTVEDLLPFWVHVLITSLEGVMRSVEDDQVLGHVLILSQYDWPRCKSRSSRVLRRIVEKRIFKFDLFFRYVINVDILEEVAFIKNQGDCKLVLGHHTESAFDFIVLNICAAGLIGAVSSPLHLYRRLWGFLDFALPALVCKISFGTEVLVPFVESTNVCTFTVLRYLSLRMPGIFSKFRPLYAKVFIALSWAFAFAFAMPWYVSAEVRDKGTPLPDRHPPACTGHLTNETYWASYRYVHAVHHIFYYIPIAVMFAVSVGIGDMIFSQRRRRKMLDIKRKSSRNSKQTQKENFIILQIVLAFLVFLLSYIPISNFQSHMLRPHSHLDENFDWWYGMGVFISMRVCEGLNSAFFFFSSKKMREETKRVWTCNRGARAPTSIPSVRRAKTFTTELPLEAFPPSPDTMSHIVESSTIYPPAEVVDKDQESSSTEHFSQVPKTVPLRAPKVAKRYLVRNSTVEKLMHEFVSKGNFLKLESAPHSESQC